MRSETLVSKQYTFNEYNRVSKIGKVRVRRYGVSLETMRSEAKARVSRQILQELVPMCPKAGASTTTLAVLDHLVHTCYGRTAQSLARSLATARGQAGGMNALLSDHDIQLIHKRQKLTQLVETGHVSQVGPALRYSHDSESLYFIQHLFE